MGGGEGYVLEIIRVWREEKRRKVYFWVFGGVEGGEECFMFEDCGLFELTFAEEISSWHLVSFSIFSREGPALNMPRETACLKRGEGRGGGSAGKGEGLWDPC